MKRIAILGSTGSIGTQALEVIEQFPEDFAVEVLTANNNVDLLIEQSKKFKPNVVVISNEDKYPQLKEALADEPVKIYAGTDAAAQVVEMSTIDIVLASMVGYAGLLPTIKAIEAKKTIALANKETLVVAGEIITNLAVENRVNILPVDSEHSAIFQCLTGEDVDSVEKILLTASGGPFRSKTKKCLEQVTHKQALNHPNWNMGAKITIDSATLMNKGFEAIEAKWLFGMSPDNIEIVVHPQSIIHSMVQFVDGSMKAQMGLPDMKLPILYSFSYPERIKTNFERFDFTAYPELTFEKPNREVFRSIDFCYDAMSKGGNLACILNAANEVAVDAFLNDKIKFLQIFDLIEQTTDKVSFIKQPDYSDYVETDKQSREIARSIIKQMK
jgi:1-deoxy-D-xylulose-5-phosphate reductoisomerase